ncbi:hypothetical protein [Neptunomonas antarctica]|uniref:Transcriptional regulator n=1 Tax=Neptunomonas antarctica TaxID=619304 RepID=A0A1N7MQH9_9GAMM|nr:hypothetical protein [Neptunomonas antarctica]SIS88312.1 hypothetical protein SAMN05421760_106267 [Neptunomonas antarctica]
MSMKTDISGWGEQPPEFIRLLVRAVETAGSITVVAERMGYGRTAISRVLSNKYDGGTTNIEARTLELFAKIQCPVMGGIKAEECQKHRNAKFTPSNPQRVALYRACQTCPNNHQCGETA